MQPNGNSTAKCCASSCKKRKRTSPIGNNVGLGSKSEKNGKLVEKVDWAILRSTDYAPFK